MARILVTGATGLVGKALCIRLNQEGHSLVVVSRQKESAVKRAMGIPLHVVTWDFDTPLPDSALVDVTHVVHLSGESIASRWTKAHKERVLRSRVVPTECLAAAIRSAPQVTVYVGASASGFYGDTNERVCVESSIMGQGFLANTTSRWERASDGVPERVRKSLLRFGIVLSAEGGALPKMLRPFRLGLGGRLGDGKQWMSFVHLDDAVEMIVQALFNENVRGVLNAVCPKPITNSDFTKTVSQVLDVPAWAHVPRFVLKGLLGDMSELALNSQRVVPEAFQKIGFKFKYPTFESALTDCV